MAVDEVSGNNVSEVSGGFETSSELGTLGADAPAQTSTVDGTADPVVLPEGINFGSADFEVSGSDLTLTMPDGVQVVIESAKFLWLYRLLIVFSLFRLARVAFMWFFHFLKGYLQQ